MSKRTTRLVVALSVTAALAALGGCGRQGRLPLVPAAGQVSWRGKPLAGAQVVLVPLGPGAADRPRPAALTGPDGKFRLSTYVKEDGAPAGEYAVTLTWGGPRKAAGLHPLAAGAAPDYFHGRYGDPKASGLRLTVGPDGGELSPIDLR